MVGMRMVDRERLPWRSGTSGEPMTPANMAGRFHGLAVFGHPPHRGSITAVTTSSPVQVSWEVRGTCGMGGSLDQYYEALTNGKYRREYDHCGALSEDGSVCWPRSSSNLEKKTLPKIHCQCRCSRTFAPGSLVYALPNFCGDTATLTYLDNDFFFLDSGICSATDSPMPAWCMQHYPFLFYTKITEITTAGCPPQETGETAIHPVRASLYLTCVVSSKSCTKGAHRAQIGGGEHESALARS